MDASALRELLYRGTPLELDAITDSNYYGIDLSLPRWVNKLAWKTFRKTMVRDPEHGVIRGWNVRLVQNGVGMPSVPMRNASGRAITFGHFVVRSAANVRFPGGWTGGHYLDFHAAGNSRLDPGRFGFCPMMAVNEGSTDLIVGWEVLKVGNVFVAPRDYWLLEREGPVDDVRPTPRPTRLLQGATFERHSRITSR